jgi:hypothetical protein
LTHVLLLDSPRFKIVLRFPTFFYGLALRFQKIISGPERTSGFFPGAFLSGEVIFCSEVFLEGEITI